ncbi:MAG: hypothetical protein DYH05_02595 [Acidobacteria bacterium ACB1]|nr:hypothetical protein [Pyrinomonadaceae bacterium]MCE7961366.1 hypothetical protein [Acidobacteria bacterium ACB1]RIJ94796.1 MAG: hypothetical protein DCC44_03730 [Acidobacteriota bacterium]
MFCPKCGNADQAPESYCRRCGIFLPDLDKPKKKAQTPIQNVNANAVLSGMTVVAAATLAILLYAILGFREDTHPLIYATAGFLIAITAWNIQTFWRSMLLRKHFKKPQRADDLQTETPVLEMPANSELPAADSDNLVPPSVVDATTRHLDEVLISTKSKQ